MIVVAKNLSVLQLFISRMPKIDLDVMSVLKKFVSGFRFTSFFVSSPNIPAGLLYQ